METAGGMPNEQDGVELHCMRNKRADTGVPDQIGHECSKTLVGTEPMDAGVNVELKVGQNRDP
eukprot:1556050-Prorocentrum_lima.AAC.1